MIEITDEQAREAYQRIRAAIAFPSEAISLALTQTEEIDAETIREMINITTSVLSKSRPIISERMIVLAFSEDKRRCRRGWRIYFRTNGRRAHAYHMREVLREMERIHSQPKLTAEHLEMIRAFGSVAAALAAKNNAAIPSPTTAQESK